MKTTATLVMCGLLLLAGAFDASGQSFQGGIRGAVRDANGVIPGAEVTLTNQDTNVARTTVSNEVGEYNFPNVAPGTYTLKAVLTGFKSFERSGVRIGTQQFITLDLPLEVGNIQESITVTGDAPLIETSNASTGGTLDQEALESLPAPGRNAFLIGVTIPTVNHVGDPQFDRQQDQSNASRISLGGGGVRANNYLLDGVSITELSGRAILNPTIEAVSEIKVQVHTYDGEMGRTGGGVFNTTMKSGTNVFHGTGFYQTRPVWGQSENFFNEKQGLSKDETGLSDAYYRLYGGGVGGPIIKDRTFFWAATEGYRSGTTRGLQEVWPGRNQRAGDFSQSTINGVPVRIFNPYCRGGSSNARCPSSGTGSIATGGEFTNAIIPRGHPAASETGFNLLNQWPTETLTGPMGTNEDNEPNAIGTGTLDDTADMIAFRADHKISDSWTLNGSYIYNKTDEPGSTLMKADSLFIANTSEWFGPLRRRPHVLVVNNTNVLNNTTVLTLRYGWTTWYDSCDKQAFSPGLASLGFSPSFVNELGSGGSDTFPVMSFTNVSEVGGWGGTIPTRWDSPYSINGTLTKLWGSHSFKVGADFRKLSVATVSSSELGGRFAFSPNFSSRNGVGGHDLASVLVGAADSGEAVDGPGPLEWFTKYWGMYFQDDFRVNSRFTVNYGVRLEHDDGLREIENRQTVAFDRDVVNPLDARVPKTGLLAGQTLRGGLIYAGVDGAPTEQGDPAAVKVAPRFGATYALNDRTVLRGGYGLFYAPWQYDAGGRHGQTGFSRVTAMSQSASESEVPITTLDNPFPGGLEEPMGGSLGLLTGVGGPVQFIDQTKGSPKVHQYLIDVQRELPGNMAVTLGYVGATGREIGFGGTEGATFININQIDPEVARQAFPGAGGGWDAAALRASVPNPFFGVEGAGEFASRETIQQGQLLRPFPQFGDILMLESTEGSRRQYHAITAVLDKRTGARGWTGWGGRFSYTWSRSEDNQFGESSTYADESPNNRKQPQNAYDLDAEYSTSLYDSPHRIVLAPIIQFPEPSTQGGVKWWLLGGWSASAIVDFISGSPLNPIMSDGVSDSNLGLFGGQQRPDLVGDPDTPGSDEDRVASADHPEARWFDADAFASPGPGRYGTAARTISDSRYQFRSKVDVVFTKDATFANRHTGQIRFEILNLLNKARFNGDSMSGAVDSAPFGRITSIRGFMRIWQLSFRYRF